MILYFGLNKNKIMIFFKFSNNNDDDTKHQDSRNAFIHSKNRIFKNLEYQQIRCQFLKSIDEIDLRNLGFELFEHQVLLKKSIGKEKKINNINEITLKNDTIIRPFLIRFDKYVSYFNRIQRYNYCRADRFKWKNKRCSKAHTFWLKKYGYFRAMPSSYNHVHFEDGPRQDIIIIPDVHNIGEIEYLKPKIIKI